MHFFSFVLVIKRKTVTLQTEITKKDTMSTATLTSLLDYLTGALTTDNKQWLADHLYQQVREKESLTPYTMEEINSRIDQAERESAAGLGQDSEEMFREMEEEFMREELEMAEAV